MHLNTLEIILGSITLLLALGLVIVIAMQHSKKSGLGSVMGGSSDSYYGRNKARSKENILKKLTVIFAVALAVIALILYAYHGSTSGTKTPSSSSSAPSESSAVAVSDVSSDNSAEESDTSEEPSETSETSEASVADNSEDGSAAE